MKLAVLLLLLIPPMLAVWALCPHSDYLTQTGSCRAFELAEGVRVAFCVDW